jgi:hypothetical protein
MIRRLSTIFAVSLLFLLSASFAGANSTELLTFSGLENGQLVGNFYNGSGLASTPNFGVTFSSNIYALWPVSRGGSGNFSPTFFGTPAIFISGKTGSPAIGSMNVANGFTSGINFFYTAAFQETATVWSGANGTGTLLATITLSPNDGNCSPVSYCNWTNIGLTFSGTADSVTFSGPANGMGISDITLGQGTTAIPEPSSIYLLGIGIVGICAKCIPRLVKG